MRLQQVNTTLHGRWSPSLLAKFAGVLLLFAFMILIVACGSASSNGNLSNGPVVTITISFGQNSSPTPALKSNYCGGWATNTTTAYTTNGVVSVYGKFTQLDKNDNPVGISGATATATILWPDGSTQTETQTTTSDGLAVFSIPLRPSAIDHIVLIQMSFSKGALSCTIPQAAFFTALVVSPTPNGSKTPKPSPSPNGSQTPTATPSVSPTVSGSVTPTIVPTLPLPSPSPTK
jgi:hypothetical protein